MSEPLLESKSWSSSTSFPVGCSSTLNAFLCSLTSTPFLRTLWTKQYDFIKNSNNLTEYRHVVFAPHLKGYTTTPNQTEDEKQRNWPEKSSFLIPNKEIQYPRSITKNIVRQLILTSLNPKKWQRKRELQPSKEKHGRQFMKHIKTHNIFKKFFLLVC